MIKAHGQAPGQRGRRDRPDALSRRRRRRRRSWTGRADVNISGTLASVGARLIEGTANKMIGQTFDCMETKLEARLRGRPSSGDRDGAPPSGRRAGRDERPHAGGRADRARRSRSTPRPRRCAWIADELAARDWTLKLIVSTHGHWDHIGDNAAVAAHTGAEIAVHPLDRERLERPAAAVRAVRDPAVGARRSSSPRAARSGSARSACGSSTRPATPRARSACSPRTTACCSAATRCSPAAGVGWTCLAATRRRWSRRSRASPGSRTTAASSRVTAPATTIGRERAWLELVRDGGRLFA